MPITNPVLAGFNPDPSFLRVGEDYYLATSTFEWYPGVQIHHSKDLVNWTLAARPLNRASLLDMRGNPDSGGVWAPCLSFSDKLFWLVYTDVKRIDGNFKDTHNYITTCKTVDGVWSDPFYVNSHGFDPSLFHDDDGRKYFLNMRWNHRGAGTGINPAHDAFDGILLQEWTPESGLSGEVHNIYAGSPRGLTEAPHLFKRNNWYYLTVAEGGTGYQHAITMARSRNLTGPYETQPDLHLLHVDGDTNPELPIHRTGHGQYVETHWGDVYHSFLMGRPLTAANGKRFCPMGRESGLERCVWGEDDWLYTASGSQAAQIEVTAPDIAAPKTEKESGISQRTDEHPESESKDILRVFNSTELPTEFQWLRTPFAERLFQCTENGLVLFGRESIGSWFEQALVARRQEHFAYAAETVLQYEPQNYQQAAGLLTYYNRHKFHALLLTFEEDFGTCLTIFSCEGDYPEAALSFPLSKPESVEANEIELRVEVNGLTQQFSWRYRGQTQWQNFGPMLDASFISDEGGRGEHASFTGTFCGMIAFDLTGSARPATFQSFNYLPQTATTR